MEAVSGGERWDEILNGSLSSDRCTLTLMAGVAAFDRATFESAGECGWGGDNAESEFG